MDHLSHTVIKMTFSFSKWGCVVSHYTTHSFDIICRSGKVGLADQMMRSFYKQHSCLCYAIHCII